MCMICKFAYQCHIGLLKSYRYFMTYRDMIPLHLTSGLQDDVWDRIDEIFNEPFIGSSSKNSKQLQDHGTVQQADFNPVHYDNIQEVQQVRRCIQKKLIMADFWVILRKR